MGATFTIEQTPTSQNLYIYPDSSSAATTMTAVGETENFECIDETRTVPDIDTYIYTTSITPQTDYYTLTDHTTENGDINYVMLYGRGKSHLVNQNSTGTYDLILRVKDIGSSYYTDYLNSEATYGKDIDLITSYKTVNCLWSSNPSTQTVWTWTDIDNLQMGITASSPSVFAGTFQMSLVPNGEGYTTELYNFQEDLGDPTNYIYVDEIGGGGYVYSLLNYTGVMRDSYEIENSTDIGTITNLTVFYSICNRTHDPNLRKGRSMVSTHNTLYYGSWNNPPWCNSSNWNIYSEEYINNPNTSSAWTWEEVDDLQLGIELQAGLPTGSGLRCHYIYALIDYYKQTNPEIRTTQCYAKVNYTPSSSTCYLLKPTSYTWNNSREIKTVNFFNEDREVYDLQRANKTLSMSGIEYNRTESDATDTLSCIKTFADKGSKIGISGMDDLNLNTYWMITNFDFNQDSNNPNIWNWNMELEKYES